jgi:hypothetical protein
MTTPAVIQIIGTPIACANGIRETWRDVATFTASKLSIYFGDAFQLEYYDLFDPACPAFPENSQIPIVMVNGALFSSGGKISFPAIRRHLEVLGLKSLIRPDAGSIEIVPRESK